MENEIELINQIKEQRQKEIEAGENLITYPPIYVVYDVLEKYSEGDADYPISTSLFKDEDNYWWVNPEEEEKWSCDEYEDKMEKLQKKLQFCPEEEKPEVERELKILSDAELVRVGYYDRFITICFTREAAESFIRRERHNLNNPQIWVDVIPRWNNQLRQIGIMFGDDIF